MLKSNPVGWFEIYVNDMARARAFYENVFDTKLEVLKTPATDLEMLAFSSDFNAYGSPGALVKMPGVEAGHNSVIIYFSCKDCAIEEGRATREGGRVHKPKMSIGEYGYISLVYDSESNMIGLHTPAEM